MNQDMKILKFILIAMLSLFAVSCNKDKQPDAIDIAGEWELVDMQTKSITIGGQTVDIFITFREDNTFHIRQMLGTGRFREYDGSWTLEGDLLDGTYDDGSKWAAPYKISITDGLLHMTPDYDESTYVYPLETYVYRKIG